MSDVVTPAQHLETALAAMKRAIGAVSEHRFIGSGYTRTQIEVVHVLRQEADVTAGELARRLHLTRGAITQTAETLVARGLIERVPDESDRRIVRLRLSQAGYALAATLMAHRSAIIHRIVQQLSPDETQATIIAIERLTLAIEAELNSSERT